ncbi:MAG: hypothetical protein OEZ02_08695 [Anaerolineae bacterium]|nr:hypothetical protein [Anaerolineae bacterium]
MIPPEILEFFGEIMSVLLTLVVLLYVFGDNPGFRLAIHIFIGVAAGYAAGVAWYAVIMPHLIEPLMNFNSGQVSVITLLVRIGFVSLLLTKVSPRAAVLGNPATAFLVGVGAAAAIGGAIQGTLFPLVLGSSGIFHGEAIRAAVQGDQITTVIKLVFFDGTIVLIGTITTLVYFHFGARTQKNEPPQRPLVIKWMAWVGQLFISVTFGVLFAGVFMAALNALVERFFFIWQFILKLNLQELSKLW